MRVEGGDGRALVAEIDLDLAEVLAPFQQMSGVGMAQGVNVGLLFDAAGFEGQTEGALESGAAHRFGGGGGTLAAMALGGEKEDGMLVREPLLAQQEQGPFGERNITIPAAFTAADVEQAALAIDVADLQTKPFAQAQAAGVDQGETNAMIQSRDGGEDPADLGGGEHDREFELPAT